MDEGGAMLLVLCGVGTVVFAAAGLLFVGTPGWPAAVGFFFVAGMMGWICSRIVRET